MTSEIICPNCDTIAVANRHTGAVSGNRELSLLPLFGDRKHETSNAENVRGLTIKGELR